MFRVVHSQYFDLDNGKMDRFLRISIAEEKEEETTGDDEDTDEEEGEEEDDEEESTGEEDESGEGNWSADAEG